MTEIFTDKGFKSLHDKPKSIIRAVIQKLFLKILSKLFPKKFLFYKNKIKFLMNKSGFYLYLFSIASCLRIKYPMYFRLPSKQIYALHVLIKFLKTLEIKKINFFLVGGCLLGAVRQKSFAGRPSDIDLGIKEEELSKLLETIPIVIKSGARFIRKRPSNDEIERLQISYPCMLVDIGIYRKSNVGGKEVWGNKGGEVMYDYQKNWIEKNEKNYVRKFEYFTFPMNSLIPIKVYGRNFLAPSNPEIYLEKKFGKNWKIPDKKQFLWNS